MLSAKCTNLSEAGKSKEKETDEIHASRELGEFWVFGWHCWFLAGLPIEKRVEQSPTHLSISKCAKSSDEQCPAKPQCQSERSKHGASHLLLKWNHPGMEAAHAEQCMAKYHGAAGSERDTYVVWWRKGISWKAAKEMEIIILFMHKIQMSVCFLNGFGCLNSWS